MGTRICLPRSKVAAVIRLTTYLICYHGEYTLMFATLLLYALKVWYVDVRSSLTYLYLTINIAMIVLKTCQH